MRALGHYHSSFNFYIWLLSCTSGWIRYLLFINIPDILYIWKVAQLGPVCCVGPNPIIGQSQDAQEYTIETNSLKRSRLGLLHALGNEGLRSSGVNLMSLNSS